MNPTLSSEFLAREERRDPDAYRGEYLAELVGSGGAFLDPYTLQYTLRTKRAIALSGRDDAQPRKG